MNDPEWPVARECGCLRPCFCDIFEDLEDLELFEREDEHEHEHDLARDVKTSTGLSDFTPEARAALDALLDAHLEEARAALDALLDAHLEARQ